jgi:Malectin domain/Pectate lyase superfamily protein/F5/8 type C domain/Abnormal spindle-like microcephaly-assoc'd, ASPM-SPD-2-Hydin/Fibronectin type III domain
MKRIAQFFATLLTVLSGVPPYVHAQTPGAPVPFVEFNAATSAGVQTNGTLIGPNYYFGTLASEATGRQAVLLSGQGKYVSFTLTAPANAITVHYAIPDAPAGNGITQPLSLYASGAFTTSLSLTSAYSWLYGAYEFSKTPGIGMPGTLAPHDFYNDVRYMFSSTLPTGTVVKLQVDSGDNAPWYLINTVDFEQVPAAISAPSNAINVTQPPYSVNNTGTTDVTSALQNAINAAESSGQVVYLPTGTYTISQPLAVNNVTIEGAGEWYTVLTGSNVEFAGQIAPASTNVNISNLAIFGNVAVRNDSDGEVNGFNGGFSNSSISNVWIQNTKVGAWIVGPATGLTFNNLRIMDLKADGINFNAANGPITTATIENTFFRNTQDDGMAMWAENAPDTNITLNQNTVISPGLANNIAIYGAGSGDVITNNLLEDPVTRGSCIHDGLRFSAVATSGPVTIENNKLERCGQYDPGFYFGVGAIWFWPLDGNMESAVNLSGNVIQNSPYSAYMFLGPSDTTDVSVNDDTVTGVGTFVVHAQGPGAATVNNTPATGVPASGGGFLNLGCDSGFTLTASGDSGWSSTPICNVPAANPLWVYPDVVTFQTTPGQALTEQVAVINAAYQATTIGPISASGGFTVVADPTYPCGASLVAGEYGGASEPGYCLVDVTFNPAGSGITSGTLTIPNSAGNTVIVQLVGSSGGNTLINPPQVTPSSLAFGYELVGSTTAAQSVTLTNPTGAATLTIGTITTTSGFKATDNCGSTLGGGDSCTISVTFAPTAGGTLAGSLAISNSATSTPIGVSLSGTGYSSTTNLATGATATATSTESGFPASNVNDGNTSTYWESLDGSGYPQTITLNFGAILPLGSVTLDLPPSTAWTTRSETFSVQGSTNGSTYATLIPSASYTFNPATGNTVSFNLPAGTSEQYLQLVFTANTGWDAAQLSEFEVFPGSGSSCTPGAPAAPTGLGATAASSSQINLSWSASPTSGVTYSVFRSTTSGFTPSASNQVTTGLTTTVYSDTGLAASTTYYYIVQAENCAGSASSNQASGTTLTNTTAPTTPAGLTATAGNTTVALSWTASTGTAPITYSVFRGTSSGGESATAIATGLTTPSYNNTGLTNGTTYYYEVSATNSVGTSAKSTQANATPEAVSNTLLQINAGGGATGTFVADEFFNNGNEYSTTNAVSTAGVVNAAPEAVYQSVRWAPAFTYIIPGLAAGSSYTVRLHFAELSWTADGQREFNVAINGTQVLTNFDVFATAGGQYIAVVKQFTATADSLGQITISFNKGAADNPEIAGIEILGAGTIMPIPPAVLQIDSGSPTAVSTFVADTDFNTGNEFSSSATIATANTYNPAPAAVYQTVRWASSFTYTIPGLTAGKTYAVRLHFAELSWTAAGQRVFNVAINGTSVLSDFDIIATSGAENRAITEQFNTTANSSGQIVISFTNGGADNPEVNGIEILQ